MEARVSNVVREHGKWVQSPTIRRAQPLPKGGGGGDNGDMTATITRDEFQAELRAMRAEMAASQTELRADFASMRTVFAESQRDTLKAVSVVAESVAEIRGEMAGIRGEIVGVRGEMDGVRGYLSGEIKGLHGEIAGVKSSLTTTQWTVGIVVGLSAVLVAGVQLFVAYKAPQPTSQPPVIYIQPAPGIQTPPSVPSPE